MRSKMRTVMHIALFFASMCVVAQTSKTSAMPPAPIEVMCGLQTYQDSLNFAFDQATAVDGQTLVSIQVLPSFQREYALTLKQTESGLMLLRTGFRSQFWSDFVARFRNTRQQCLEAAKSAATDTAVVVAPADELIGLWTRFHHTNLDTDSCPRKGKQCVHVLDGTGYVIRTSRSRLLRLTETDGMKGITSENDALLDWVHSVLQTGKTSRPPNLP